MKKQYLFKLIIALLLFSNISFAQTVNKDYIDGQVYFAISHKQYIDLTKNPELKTNLNRLNYFSFLAPIFEKYNVTSIKQVFNNAKSENILRIIRIDFSKRNEVENLISDLSKTKGLYNVEKVPLHHLFATTNDPYNGTVSGVNWNWPLDVVNASGAWDIAFGNNSIAVGIVDGAILNTHEDINDAVVAAYDGQTGSTGSSAPPSNTYEWSHGTHCAGLIAAETNNNTGISSLGSGVNLYTAKCGRDSDGSLYYLAEALNWIADQPIKVLSLSLGGPSSSTNEQDFYTYLHNTNDIVILAAAGNDGVTTISYPAGYDNVIAVASTDEDDTRSDFSNYGSSWVDIAAPGGSSSQGAGLLSSTACDATDASSGIAPSDYGISGQYNMMSGTSMATPLSAGLVGLMRSYNPSLSASEIETCLFNTCVNVGTFVAHGRIDAQAAMQCIQNSNGLNANFSANNTTINEGQSVNFTDLSTDGGTAITNWSWSFPNGSPSSYTGQNPPSITYANAGNYNVTLTVNNGTSDTETKTAYIHVLTPSYCPSSGNTTYGTSVTLVNLNTINNATAQTNPYEDYTNISTDLERGSSYDLTVNVNTDGNYQVFGKVWIDWNHDFDFDDAGEEILMGNASNVSDGPTANSPLSITVPSGAAIGATRMRVSAKYEDPDVTEGSATSCEEDYDGEVEDYTINITTSTVSVLTINKNQINIYPNPNNGEFTITLYNSEKTNVNIYNLNGKLVFEDTQFTTNKAYNLSDLGSGVYIIKFISTDNIYTQKITIQ